MSQVLSISFSQTWSFAILVQESENKWGQNRLAPFHLQVGNLAVEAIDNEIWKVQPAPQVSLVGML